MKARGRLLFLLCAIALLVVPTNAAAKPGYNFIPAGFFLSASLPKSNGYRIHLGSVSHRWVEMSVYRHGTIAIYLAKGKVNRHGVDVDFGRFGHVRADFKGRRLESEPVFPGCRGRRAIEARGRLEGSFRFRGEGGYVNLSAKRAKASYERSFRWVCWFGPESPRDKEVADVLEATGTVKGRKVNFEATHLPSIGMPVISASTAERIGGVIAFKLATTAGDDESLLEFSPPQGLPQAVTVKPTFPFRGSASYMAQPDGSSEWSGDLRVPLPGLGQVPLTGSAFKADACRTPLSAEVALTCKPQPKGAPRLGALARLPYGSGSHSQPLALARLSSLR